MDEAKIQSYEELIGRLNKANNELLFQRNTLEHNIKLAKNENAALDTRLRLSLKEGVVKWEELKQWRKFKEVVMAYRDMSYDMRELFLYIVDMEKELENERKHNEED